MAPTIHLQSHSWQSWRHTGDAYLFGVLLHVIVAAYSVSRQRVERAVFTGSVAPIILNTLLLPQTMQLIGSGSYRHPFKVNCWCVPSFITADASYVGSGKVVDGPVKG